jgi:signal transduction histidine kinase
VSNIKPLTSDSQDRDALQELGRASVQIDHDLKNQLNGLKLYATFLRKRMEKAGRPDDEQETLAKLIAGLERAAADMATLVRYGRPVELKRQPRVDLCKILAEVSKGEDGAESPGIEAEACPHEGEFDSAAISEALKAITARARAARRADGHSPFTIHVRHEEAAGGPCIIIEWRGVKTAGEPDPFRSFVGGEGLRMSLAAKLIEAHGGEASRTDDSLRVRLPVAARNS